MLFCQPLSDSSESLIDLLLLPASIALQIKNDVGQEAIGIGQNNTARSWRLKLSRGGRSRRPTDTGLRGKKKMEKKDETRGLAPLPGTPLAGALSTTLQDVLPRGSDAPRRSVAVPAPRGRGGGGEVPATTPGAFPWGLPPAGGLGEARRMCCGWGA